MDKKITGSDARNYQSIDQLIKDAYGLNAKQLEKRMEWAMKVAESGSCLKGKPIPEAPENEFRIIKAKMAARGITPRVMADFDEETQKAMQREDYIDSTLVLPHQKAEQERTSWNPVAEVKEFWEMKKKRYRKVIRMAGMAAACMVFVAAVILVPRIDAIAKKNYRYEARVESGETGKIVWNNQNNYISKPGKLEEAYAEIKETLGEPILKLGYMPEGMEFAELEIKNGFARMEFVYAGNSVRMFEVLYLQDSSGSYSSDRNTYKFVKNEWIGKDIPIRKNEISTEKYEYCAYVGEANAYFILEGIMDEKDFIKIVENIVFN